MASFKDRCKELEQELDIIRGSDQPSIFGNSSVSYAGKANTTVSAMNTTKNYDFEVKRMKDMFT